MQLKYAHAHFTFWYIISIIASEYYHTLRVNNGNPIAKKKQTQNTMTQNACEVHIFKNKTETNWIYNTKKLEIKRIARKLIYQSICVCICGHFV